MCDQLVSFNDIQVFASSSSEFNSKIKESFLLLLDQPILNKKLPIYLLD